MITKEAVKLLVFSGGSAILFSSILGLFMLIPMQKDPSKENTTPSTIIFKHIGAAHIDWIMLGLMLGLAAALIQIFELTTEPFAVVCLIFGAWMNPLPYVFRAFGINAFRFGGSIVQRLAATLGITSSLAIVFGWIHILLAAWNSGF